MKTHFLVKGRVIGVGYRSLVNRIALETGVAGFVKNLADDVEVHVEGEEKQVKEFLKRISVKSNSFIGPHVESVQEMECKCKQYEDFRILF